jgi:acetylornithine deacetylase/succinyl-diaminopimelate desuccinylase-like protein
MIGMEGIPSPGDAGNVLRPYTAAKISLRLPPTLDGEAAERLASEVLLTDPPYGAKVSFTPEKASSGWHAPALAPWLAASLERASQSSFGRGAAMMGEGGSIPFMGMLGEKFPAAQFVITGVLGPHSNAHGPNEFLHLPTGKKVTGVIAQVIADHAVRAR